MKIPSANFKITREERKVLADFYEAMLDEQFFNWTTDDICDVLDSIRIWEQMDPAGNYYNMHGITFEVED